MESDDLDTYIVVVGDDIESFPECLQKVEEGVYPVSEDLLEEPREESNLENPRPIKHESENENNDMEVEVPPKENIEVEFLSDDAELSDDGAKVPQTKMGLRSRTRKRTPAERHSYVKSIKKLHPELRKSKKLLIDSLVAIMKETKPPPLPKDYFMMDGIMFQCIKCSHQSESMAAAGRHYQEKHGERYLYCLACGVNFRSKTNLYKHEKSCEAEDAALVLRARADFLGNRAGARPFAPQRAPSAKRKKSPKKFDCQECSASFASSQSLTAHAHMHAGRLPYVCRICLRGYTLKITLDRHVKKHDETQRFVCDHCQRSFNAKPSLVAHLNTHLPLKRFACDECDKRYAQRAALLLHVNRTHRGLPPPFACQLCPKRYGRMSVLKEHMGKVHGMDLITRNMFLKALPTLTKVQVPQAKIVMKNDLQKDPVYYSVEN
ncbi:gastrula zinc finger protein XlCGF26.1-like isoform X2 [Maniola jurtina]|uniref:gastrula zinc finger protein XlCGF26.1-like isoform X2 n=1 Tax=Maniola jurtina TaxID=191418 RepID=UPI001E68C51C|nr:gastrula zinc finger protein XlCGF26.1-like isoform X2 [Maniola jurtina]